MVEIHNLVTTHAQNSVCEISFRLYLLFYFCCCVCSCCFDVALVVTFRRQESAEEEKGEKLRIISLSINPVGAIDKSDEKRFRFYLIVVPSNLII